MPNVTRSGVWRKKKSWGEVGLKISLKEIGACFLLFLFLIDLPTPCRSRDQVYQHFGQKGLEEVNLFPFFFFIPIHFKISGDFCEILKALSKM